MIASAVILLVLSPVATLHGTVRAEATREPIAYAVVEIVELARRVAADARGYFVLPGVPAGRWRVRASALGYRPLEVEADLTERGSLLLEFELTLEPIRLSEIEVRTEAEGATRVSAPGPPPVRVDGPTLSTVPGLAEADVLRALQMLPAIAAASDFSSALYVRGGSPDQNLLLLDGAPLFNP